MSARELISKGWDPLHQWVRMVPLAIAGPRENIIDGIDIHSPDPISTLLILPQEEISSDSKCLIIWFSIMFR
jgi:hypothetical protein